MWDAWAAGDRKGALAAIPDEVVDDLIVHGSFAECRAHIRRYMDSGITIPALAVIPIGVDLGEALAGLSPSADSADRAPHGTPSNSPIDFRTTSLADLAAAVRARQISARELTSPRPRAHQRPQPHL